LRHVGPTPSIAWSTASALSFAMLIVGLVGLVRSAAAGTGWLPRIGFAGAFLGLCL
jgi:hypothetical protein